jgi:plastocyanin
MHLSRNQRAASQNTARHSALQRFGMLTCTVIAGALLLSACSGGSTPSSTGSTQPQRSGGSSVTIANFAFSPATITVAPGATVSVTNKDTVVHTLTSLTSVFNTGNIQPNQTLTFTAPTKPGRYPYDCNIHQFMKGVLVVS